MKTRRVVLHNGKQVGSTGYFQLKSLLPMLRHNQSQSRHVLNDLSVRGCQLRIRRGPAQEDAQVSDFIQMKCGYTGWCGNRDEVGAIDVVQKKNWDVGPAASIGSPHDSSQGC